MSMDLNFESPPGDLPKKFVECLVLLPNLNTLEIFSTGHGELYLGGFRWGSIRFPGIRELEIDRMTMELVGRCPNVESVTVRRPFSSRGVAFLGSYGKGLKKLKRVVGVHEGTIKSGKLKDILAGGTCSLAIHHGSCAELFGPPGNWHQGCDWVLRCTWCESLCPGLANISTSHLISPSSEMPNTSNH